MAHAGAVPDAQLRNADCTDELMQFMLPGYRMLLYHKRLVALLHNAAHCLETIATLKIDQSDSCCIAGSIEHCVITQVSYKRSLRILQCSFMFSLHRVRTKIGEGARYYDSDSTMTVKQHLSTQWGPHTFSSKSAKMEYH